MARSVQGANLHRPEGAAAQEHRAHRRLAVRQRGESPSRRSHDGKGRHRDSTRRSGGFHPGLLVQCLRDVQSDSLRQVEHQGLHGDEQRRARPDAPRSLRSGHAAGAAGRVGSAQSCRLWQRQLLRRHQRAGRYRLRRRSRSHLLEESRLGERLQDHQEQAAGQRAQRGFHHQGREAMDDRREQRPGARRALSIRPRHEEADLPIQRLRQAPARSARGRETDQLQVVRRPGHSGVSHAARRCRAQESSAHRIPARRTVGP